MAEKCFGCQKCPVTQYNHKHCRPHGANKKLPVSQTHIQLHNPHRTNPAPIIICFRATKQALTSSHNMLANSSPLRRWTLMGVELGKTLVMTQICPRLQKLMQYEMIRLMTNFSCDKPQKKHHGQPTDIPGTTAAAGSHCQKC